MKAISHLIIITKQQAQVDGLHNETSPLLHFNMS